MSVFDSEGYCISNTYFCVCMPEGDEPIEGTIVIRNIGNGSSEDDSQSPVIFRITSTTPNRFMIGDCDGLLHLDETLNIPVILKSFPSLLASQDTPIAEIFVDITQYNESFYDGDPMAFWNTIVGDNYVRKKVSCMAIGYEARDRVEAKLRGESVNEAMIDFDGTDHHSNSAAIADPILSSGHIKDIYMDDDTFAPKTYETAAPFDGCFPQTSVFPKCLFFLGNT